MNIRMANHDDIEKLIKARFDYFDMEKYEIHRRITSVRYTFHSKQLFCQ